MESRDTHLWDDGTVRLLQDSLGDEDPEVRWRLLWALARHDRFDAPYLPALVSALRVGPVEVQWHAARILAAVGDRISKTVENLALLEEAETRPSPWTR